MEQSVGAIKDRLDLVIKRFSTYKQKKFSKLPAKSALEDFDFLIMVLTVLSEANQELKEQLLELQPGPGKLVGVDGRALSKDEPLIVV